MVLLRDFGTLSRVLPCQAGMPALLIWRLAYVSMSLWLWLHGQADLRDTACHVHASAHPRVPELCRWSRRRAPRSSTGPSRRPRWRSGAAASRAWPRMWSAWCWCAFHSLAANIGAAAWRELPRMEARAADEDRLPQLHVM